MELLNLLLIKPIIEIKYRLKRVIQFSRDVLKTREININLIYKTGNVKLSYSFPLEKFLDYLDNLSSIPELDRFIEIKTYEKPRNQIFKGVIDYPQYYWGIRPDLKNHVGAPKYRTNRFISRWRG